MQEFKVGDRIIYHGEPRWKNFHQQVSDFPGWVIEVREDSILCRMPLVGEMEFREGDTFEKVERPWINYRVLSGSRIKEYRASKGREIYFTKDRNDPNILKWVSQHEAQVVAARLNLQPEVCGIGSEEL